MHIFNFNTLFSIYKEKCSVIKNRQVCAAFLKRNHLSVFSYRENNTTPISFAHLFFPISLFNDYIIFMLDLEFYFTFLFRWTF